MSWEIRSGTVVFTGSAGWTFEVDTMEDADREVGIYMECGCGFSPFAHLGRDDRHKLIEVLAAMDGLDE